MLALPILYSYRRCPYAMRARMALKLANIDVEIREISLRDKPAHMLKLSPKGTVPVLILVDNRVIDESIEIMRWAFCAAINNRQQITSLKRDLLAPNIDIPSKDSLEIALININDTSFKQNLDGYKYPERNPIQNHIQNHEQSPLGHRQAGEVFLAQLEQLLQQNSYLFGAKPCFADYAIWPFIRQFAAVDYAWFNGDESKKPPYPILRIWLNTWLDSALFAQIMQKRLAYQA